MLFIVIWLLIWLVIGILIYKNKNKYISQGIILFLMYGLYVYLWFLPAIVNNTTHTDKHPTDVAMGVAILFIFSMPVYLLIHTLFLWYAKRKRLKKIFRIHFIGIILLTIQTLLFLVKTNFLR